MHGVEPTARLVHALGDEIRRIAHVEGRVERTRIVGLQFFVVEAPLRVGHAAAVEPHVNEVALALHRLAARTYQRDAVHVRFVQIDGIILRCGRMFRVEVLKRILGHHTGLDGAFDLRFQLREGTNA